ncbi:WecB/TagA/CpsF family glycosyltransferase [Dactylosporangium sp. McL0621]|uniref:WecB/TagA/CpsF family glycosyltransferase n=1 Tax=Dactylosporangium sp. McL0621 TaxID=3415678 RepID=UPI003CEB5347
MGGGFTQRHGAAAHLADGFTQRDGAHGAAARPAGGFTQRDGAHGAAARLGGGFTQRDGAHGAAAHLAGGRTHLDGAHRAAARLAEDCPGLRIAGAYCPPFGFDRDPRLLWAVCARVIKAQPQMVYVGIGFPRQEHLIASLREALPATWFLGCGAAVNFVAGDIQRARPALQKAGLEWLDRLAREPQRLARRYLREDAPFAAALLARSLHHRLTPVGPRTERELPEGVRNLRACAAWGRESRKARMP